MDLKPNFTQSPSVKVMLNVGACLDIPSGTYVKGRFGESVLNGGLPFITGVVGIGNSFKSTIMHYMLLAAMSRFPESTAVTYDTEINIHEWHLKNFVNRFNEFGGDDIIENRRWTITDKTVYSGDQFYDIQREFMDAKIKNIKSIQRNTPFLNRERTGYLQVPVPTFTEIDSFSEFTTADVIKMQEDNSLGEKGGNTIFMRQGLGKNRFLQEIPGLSGQSNTFFLLSTHLGAEFNMDPNNPAPKKLQFLKGGQKIKGAPEKFTFATSICWHSYNAAPLINRDTKTPLYPRSPDDDLTGDTDLNEVTVRVLRNKSGPTGMTVVLVVSQEEGVLPELTEFHHIKENGRFGLGGNNTNYYLELLPDVKLSRTVIRRKIDEHPELRRALNITSEMCQMYDLWHNLDAELVCTPLQLYTDLKEMGYNWDELLATRSWWTFDNDKHEIPFLSTMDLLRMRAGLYIPFWMKEPPAKALEKFESINGKKWDRPKVF